MNVFASAQLLLWLPFLNRAALPSSTNQPSDAENPACTSCLYRSAAKGVKEKCLFLPPRRGFREESAAQ